VRIAPLAVCLLIASCGDSVGPILCDGGRCATQTSWRQTYEFPTHNAHNRSVDILLVVDDTSAMAPHASALAAGLAGIGQQLAYPGPINSLHIGAVRAGSCDASTRGLACGVGGVGSPEQFLRSEWCHTMTNFSSAFPDAVACLGDLGASNCGPAQPLATAVQLLAGPARAGWEGFLRPDAYLMIVVIAAQDDASGPPGSLTPISELAAATKALKPDTSQILVSIIGPGDCAAGDVPGPRLTYFMSEFGAFGLYMPLCSGEWSRAVERVTSMTNQAYPPPCVRGDVRDTVPGTPGLQASCTVEDSQLTASGSRITSGLPSCDQSAPPCWRLTPGAAWGCVGYSFVIDHDPDWCFEAGNSGTIECLGCADANDPACAVQP